MTVSADDTLELPVDPLAQSLAEDCVPVATVLPRVAVVLFNLGGPDAPDAVRPFLFNLFSDPSVIRLPNPFRWLIAGLRTRKRVAEANATYDRLGGKSPLLENTENQSVALQQNLKEHFGRLTPALDVKTFVAMRYWHPLSVETAQAVKDYRPHLVVVVPLYPQFSSATTASSLRVWREAAELVGLKAPERVLCCYPTDAGFIDAMASMIRPLHERASKRGKPRVLFSANGLPESVVRAGDPYQWQCERTAHSLAAALGIEDLDWVNCYQNRDDQTKWIGPSTREEIRRAGADRVPVLVVPISFVSEQSETLVEIEHDYRQLARQAGVPWFGRSPTVGVNEAFIAGLTRLVHHAASSAETICSQSGHRVCPSGFSNCPRKETPSSLEL